MDDMTFAETVVDGTRTVTRTATVTFRWLDHSYNRDALLYWLTFGGIKPEQQATVRRTA